MSLELEKKKLLEDWVSTFTSFDNIYPLPETKSFRINTLRIPIPVFDEITGIKNSTVSWYPSGRVVDEVISVGNTFEYVLGYVQPQSLSSMIPPLVLGPTAENTVLDLTSAPGSKTTQMSAMMGNRGVIVANDVPAKEGILTTNISRLGVLNVIITTENAKFYSKKNMFDKVLVDAPCSAFGSKENAFNRFSPKMSKSISGIQARILKSGFEALKPGGELVYSICSISPYEAEAVVNELIESNENAEILQIPEHLRGIPHHEGLKDYTDTNGNELVWSDDLRKAWRVYANEIDSESFFICRIRKGD